MVRGSISELRILIPLAKMLNVIQHYTRRATCVTYKDHFTQSGQVEVCDWENGEGIDVSINNLPVFQLTWGEWDALARAMRERSKAVKIEEERAKRMTS